MSLLEKASSGLGGGTTRPVSSWSASVRGVMPNGIAPTGVIKSRTRNSVAATAATTGVITITETDLRHGRCAIFAGLRGLSLVER